MSDSRIEDSLPSPGSADGITRALHIFDEQLKHLKAALEAADAAGYPDPTLQAGCDVVGLQEDATVAGDDKLVE